MTDLQRPSKLAIRNFDDIQAIASAMAMSGFFADAQDASKAMVKIMAGHELGIGPFASMTGISVIKGKPTIGGNIIASLIKNDPRYDYRIDRLDNSGCVIAFFENGEEVGRSEFTIDDAKLAGLLRKDNWKNYPRNMCFNRAISNGAKWHVPGVFGGTPVYTPDELGANVDEDDNIVDSIIDVSPTIVDQVTEFVRQTEEVETLSLEQAERVNGNMKLMEDYNGVLTPLAIKDYLAEMDIGVTMPDAARIMQKLKEK